MKKKVLITIGVIAVLIIGCLGINELNKKEISFPFKLTEVDREEEVDKFVNKSITDMGKDVNFGKVYDEGYDEIMTKKEYITMTTNIMFDSYIETLKDEKENTLNIKEKELDKKEVREMIQAEIENDLK